LGIIHRPSSRRFPFGIFFKGTKTFIPQLYKWGTFVLETGLRNSSELSKVLVLLINIPLVLLTSVVVVHYHQC
jgi:hypothetical protein